MLKIRIMFIVVVFSISSIVTAEINFEELVPVYRYYKKDNKKHRYSTSEEIMGKWKLERIEFYAYANPMEETVPIYRYYDKEGRDHLYTAKNILY